MDLREHRFRGKGVQKSVGRRGMGEGTYLVNKAGLLLPGEELWRLEGVRAE